MERQVAARRCATAPHAAWNPVGGFTDAMGRLMWSAVGDPAMMAFPFNASWMPNRVQSEVTRVEGQSGGIRVPADAIGPQPGSGVLPRVGDRTFGSAKVIYEVLASPFEDGTEMSDGRSALSVRLRLSLGSRTRRGGECLRAATRSRAGRHAGAAGRHSGRCAWKRRRMPSPKA